MSTAVTLRGRLTRDPELRYSANGKAVATFAVVTSRRVKDAQTDEWSDKDTTFWDCVAFGQQAENICNSLEKGTAVLVVGNAYQEEWEDREGAKRRSLKVTVDEVAPSLRWASAKPVKAERSDERPAQQSRQQAPAEDPWAADSPPF